MLDISEKEKEQMCEWIALNSRGYTSKDIDLPRILSYWRKAKSAYLYTLMGERLIREVPCAPLEPLDLSEGTQIKIFDIHDYLETVYAPIAYKNPHDLLVYEAISTIFNKDAVLRGSAFPDNKLELRGVCFHKGEKWYKSANKLIDKVCTDLSEENRTKMKDSIDRIQNQYSMTVQNWHNDNQNLVLSIHPLDYITMSDNECNWSSCMSWREEGDYHAGTVEMMNSTCVIVAYIAQKDRTLESDRVGWNSKRWRQLFVVHPTCIIASCPYPSSAPEYTKAAFKELSNLASEKFGWHYQPQLHKISDEELSDLHARTPKGGYMYVDYLSKTSSCAIAHRTDDVPLDEPIKYSGEAICAICGREEIDDHCSHVCASCRTEEGDYLCDCCGRYVDDVFTTTDDYCLCEACYDTWSYCCDHCGGTFYSEQNPYTEALVLLEDGEKDWQYLCPDCAKELFDKGLVIKER